MRIPPLRHGYALVGALRAACDTLGLRRVVRGRLVKHEAWEDDGGQTRSVTELHVNTVALLDAWCDRNAALVQREVYEKRGVDSLRTRRFRGGNGQAFMPLDNSPQADDLLLKQHLITVVRQHLDQVAVPGAAITLLVDGQPLVEAGVGFRDLAHTTSLPTDAAFYIYSVTKSMLAALILQLVAQGRVALDAPVQTYLPALPLTAPVTIQQLLSNTGGIPDYYALPAYFRDVQADPTQPWTVDEFLAHTLPRGLTFAPGQGWGYSNVGFLLLKLVIEQVTHQSLRTVVQERMVAPLRLQHTLVAEALDDAQILTPGYSAFLRDDDTLEDIRSRYHPGWVSHGVVISTAPDLARIYEAVFTGQLVHPRLLAAMQVPVLVPGQHPLFHQTAYGLGVMLDPQAAYGTVAGHGGEGPGYSAAALCFPNVAGHRVISVALVNRDQHDAGLTIAFRLVDALAAWLEREREAEADRQRAR